jgi:urease accessory protein
MHIAPSSTGEKTRRQTPWRAELHLGFARRHGRSVLATRRHLGPLLVQKSLHPEGDEVCHAIVVHPPGGIAGGDHLSMEIDVADDAHALVTTPAATKWYKANGVGARQDGAILVANGAVMEWLPQENIVFDAARVGMDWQIQLRGSAAFAGWDITCLGRRASGELFSSGHFHQKTRVSRDATPLWGDLIALRGGDPLMHSIIGLRGCSVFGTFIVAAGATPAEVLERCRRLQVAEGSCGVSALPDIFVARYLGHSAEHAKAYFVNIWTEVRPWYAKRSAHRPRIWDT